MKKTKVLIIASYYLPGYKAGGPIQSIKNIIANLSDEIDFKVLTLDRDLGSEKVYPEIEYDKWNKVHQGLVRYLTPKEFSSLKFLKKFLINEKFDVLYLGSSFATITLKILLLKKIGLLKNKKIIVAPRGEYSRGALGLKSMKKNLFLKIAKLTGLYKGVIWHGTTEEEVELIKKIQSKNVKIKIAENLKEIKLMKKTLKKNPQQLKLIFAGRISTMKNLVKCLDELSGIDYKGVEFDIVGPLEDKEYWNICQEKIKKLKNIKINYLGSQTNEELLKTLSKYHFFFLPTLGENFGHIILESLMAKTPVIISDRTPWRNLEEKKVGWDISLENDTKFFEIIEKCYRMENKEYQELLKYIEQYILNYNQSVKIENNLNLFKIT